MTRRSKYGAKPIVIDGIRFASKAEGRRYTELKLLETAGEVRDIECQPTFPLEIVVPHNGEVIQVGVYKADFRYLYRLAGSRLDDVTVIEDVKGGPTTAVYRLKKRMVEAQHGIQIREVRC